MTGTAVLAATASAMASECAPQPWSADTTRPSSGAYAFAQAPKKRPSSPLSGRKKPQLAQCAGAACAMGDRGPCSLVYQRSDAPSRPMADSTRDRPGAGSSPGSAGPASAASASRANQSTTPPSPSRPTSGRPPAAAGPAAASSASGSNQSPPASSPSSTTSGTSRSSSGGAGSRSPTPRSPGRSRSCHGTQSGASSASGPGSSTVSLTVTTLDLGARVTVTAQRQPA